MNENKKEFRLNYGGREVIIETGRLAKQADGAVLASSHGTEVLVTVCSAKEAKDGQDFFPLMVDYREKYYSAGKFLGGFLKREGRPGTHETLNSRLIDRPLRPLFPEGYMTETVVMASVLSYDKTGGDPEVLGALGAAAALAISDIPFGGPLGTCKVGRVAGEFILNPTIEQLKQSDLEMVVAATKDAIMMVEGEASEISEKDVIDALDFAHKSIKGFCTLVETMVKEVGRKKREFIPTTPNQALMKKVKSSFSKEASKCLTIIPKLERQEAVFLLTKNLQEDMEKNPKEYGMTEDDKGIFSKEATKAVDELMYELMRAEILEKENRIGGRKLNEVRSIETEVEVLSKTHGSSLFTRGETQVMAIATIGGDEGDQMADKLSGMESQKFYLHYTFPPFSVGEARGYRGVGRREMGHGNLAERALKKVWPEGDDNRYTVRINCEVLESNGSSSMGSVCSGSMALMDAGIKIKSPVAGVAMGLVKDKDNYKILTDIIGDEDHLGDMDFKVAGTEKGITAIQMDIKIAGISEDIYSKALDQARDGRIHILNEMAKTISTPRTELKDGVPRMEMIQIKSDDIGGLIGPGGKNIRGLQEKFGVNISVDETGLVKVIGADGAALIECKDTIQLQINGPEVGKDYDAVVVTIKEYGAFVDIAANVSGLVHISELSDERVKDVNEYLSEGDKVKVRILEIDKYNRPKMSIKAVQPLAPKEKK